MAVIPTITVDQNLDPRIADIPSGIDALSSQDAHDTLRDIEVKPSSGSFKRLVDSAGKEDLGIADVGITSTYQNVQFAFSATSSLSSGSVSTADTNGAILTDSSATFIADGCARGDWVINFTDQSVTEVLSVDSETQITTRGLRDGTDNQFDSGDLYKVWNVEEADLQGGNFVAVNASGSSINPVFTTFGRFVTNNASTAASIVETATSGLTASEAATLTNILKVLVNRLSLAEGSTGNMVIYDNDGTTPLYTFDITDKNGSAIVIPDNISTNRSAGA